MNDLQKIEFELFKVFKETCEKLELNYFLVCGSALGAARHGGFIPWDDDLDVGMYRDDYKKFMEKAPELLPEGIFLQNYKSDPKFPNIFAKLRNSNTTYIEKSCAHLDINHGIYIDIFPLDGYSAEAFAQKKFRFLLSFYKRQLSSAFKIPSTVKGKISVSMFRLFGCHKRSTMIAIKLDKLISQYPIKESDIICNHGTWYGSLDFIPADYYGKGAEALFEGMKVRVPENLDGYLSCLYGDWRKFPPPEKQRGHHFYEICDTEKPYAYYMNNKE